MINEVLKLRNRGMSIIPVAGKRSPDKDGAKRPLIPWTVYQEKMASEAEIRQWLNLYPNGDIGIVTGPISKILVLDVDGDPKEALKGINIPPTWTVKTKRGYHFYFRWADTLGSKVTTKAGILNNVDVRGEGGYVIAPPSLGHNGVPYTWEKAPHTMTLAAVPAWLLNLLPDKDVQGSRAAIPQGASTPSPLGAILDSLKEGNRNDSFTKVAGSLRARGYSSDDIYSLLSPRATEFEFPLAELDTICKSVGRYTPNKVEEVAAGSIEDFMADMEPISWICKPIIANKTVGFVAGLPETMKTWLLIDLAIECARGGGNWLGRFPVRQAKVLFIDQERFKGETQRRFKAVMAGKGVTVKDLKSNLYVRCGTTTRINLQQSYEAFRKELADIRPDIIIVDSFTTFTTLDENNRTSIQEALERIKQLRNEFNCTFLFIDHESKMVFNDQDEGAEPNYGRMVGSIGKPAAAELVLTVRRKSADTSMVYNTKNNCHSLIEPFLVRVTDVDEAKSQIRVEAF